MLHLSLMELRACWISVSDFGWTGLKFVTCDLQQPGVWSMKGVTLKFTLFTISGQKVDLWCLMRVNKCPPIFTIIKMPRKSFGMTLIVRAVFQDQRYNCWDAKLECHHLYKQLPIWVITLHVSASLYHICHCQHELILSVSSHEPLLPPHHSSLDFFLLREMYPKPKVDRSRIIQNQFPRIRDQDLGSKAWSLILGVCSWF